MTTCFRCDCGIETTLPGSVQNALCDDCKARLQQKVDEAVRGIEFEMVNGVFQRKRASRPWYEKAIEALGYFVMGAAVVFVTYRLGWWK